MSATVIGNWQINTAAHSSLVDGLVAFWKLDEASGTRFDSVGANHLTDNNTVTQTTGKVGNCAQFTRANSEYLSLADNADLSTGDIDFTFSVWFYCDSLTSEAILGKDSATGREYNLDISGGQIRWQIAGTEHLCSTTPSATTWYLLIVWHDSVADTWNIQINNGAVDSGSTSPPSDTTTEFRIGARAYVLNEDYFDGRIDAVGFWKRVLTVGERTELYNGGAGKEYPF